MIKRKKSNRKNPANFDNEKGIGRSRYHSSKQFDSVEVLMKPSIFLELAYPLDHFYPDGFEFIIDHINKELPIATPYLIIERIDNKYGYQVHGHEGRHRTTVIKNKYGDIPSKVLLIFENFMIDKLSRTLNDINRGIISEKNEYVEGPLFKY